MQAGAVFRNWLNIIHHVNKLKLSSDHFHRVKRFCKSTSIPNTSQQTGDWRKLFQTDKGLLWKVKTNMILNGEKWITLTSGNKVMICPFSWFPLALYWKFYLVQ